MTPHRAGCGCSARPWPDWPNPRRRSAAPHSPTSRSTHTHDELTTAQAYRAIAEFIPGMMALTDAIHRHHQISARTHFEGVQRDISANVVCGIGFADLSGFTALTQLLTPEELSALLNEFNATVSEVVHADGGRVVKFIGDEVMWVSSTPGATGQGRGGPRRSPEGARGQTAGPRRPRLRRWCWPSGGDYFGNTVNLAARLVAAAEPGQILATSAVRDELPEWPAIVHRNR